LGRAAAVDQLEEWTNRAGVDIHRPSSSQDRPGPVLQDACDRAIKEKYDVVRMIVWIFLPIKFANIMCCLVSFDPAYCGHEWKVVK